MTKKDAMQGAAIPAEAVSGPAPQQPKQQVVSFEDFLKVHNFSERQKLVIEALKKRLADLELEVIDKQLTIDQLVQHGSNLEARIKQLETVN